MEIAIITTAIIGVIRDGANIAAMSGASGDGAPGMNGESTNGANMSAQSVATIIITATRRTRIITTTATDPTALIKMMRDQCGRAQNHDFVLCSGSSRLQ